MTVCKKYRFLIFFYITIELISVLFNQQLHSQVIQNNGAVINAEPGSFIYVNGSLVNGSGVLDVDGMANSHAELFVTEDITNDGAFIGNGYIRLLGNWYNNFAFDANFGTVFFEGGNQLISGSSESHFYNLTLDGSGLKTQGVNAFSEGSIGFKTH